MRRLDARLPLTAMIAAAALGCASAQKPAAAPAAAPLPKPAPAASAAAPIATTAPAIDSGLVFAVEPAEAEILVDGRAAGTVAGLSETGGILRLAPGIYQVSLKAAGYVTWRAEVALRAGTETLRVKLTRK